MPGLFTAAVISLHLGIFLMQLLGFAALFSTLWACRHVQKAWENQLAVEALSQASQAQRVYVEEARRRYSQTKAVRHDFKNHLLILDGLLAAGRVQEARAYLSKLDAAVQTSSLPAYTGNPVVDVLLSEKIRQAQDADIRVMTEGTLSSGPEDFDLCVLFANAMDNAIQACEKLRSEKMISISCIRQGEVLLIRGRNTCVPGIRGLPGTGLRNIQAAAEKYDGTLRTRLEGNTYLPEVLLHISEPYGYS